MEQRPASTPPPLDDQRLALLDSIPASIAVIDSDGTIRAVNAGWREFAASNAHDGESDIGASYLELAQLDDDDARDSARGVLEVVTGATPEFALVYPCHSPSEQRWFELLIVPLAAGTPRPVLALHIRVNPLFDADDRLRRIAGCAIGQLEGITTVCAWCRSRHRTPAGDWAVMDPPPDPDALHHSHGICDDCLSNVLLDAG